MGISNITTCFQEWQRWYRSRSTPRIHQRTHKCGNFEHPALQGYLLLHLTLELGRLSESSGTVLNKEVYKWQVTIGLALVGHPTQGSNYGHLQPTTAIYFHESMRLKPALYPPSYKGAPKIKKWLYLRCGRKL